MIEELQRIHSLESQTCLEPSDGLLCETGQSAVEVELRARVNSLAICPGGDTTGGRNDALLACIIVFFRLSSRQEDMEKPHEFNDYRPRH